MDELSLNLPNFDGPLDLLLQLIKQQKIDIYDIPIAKITAQYLNYLSQMQELQLEVAGEYFVMAATLLRIKSSLLLPRNEYVDPEDMDEDYDPRQELVDQLLQYELYQKVAEFLEEQDIQTPKVFSREPVVFEEDKITPLETGIVAENDLVATFSKILYRLELRQPKSATITMAEVSLSDQIALLEQKITEAPEISFFGLIDQNATVQSVVALFMAMLELISKKVVQVRQNAEFTDLLIRKWEPIDV